VIPFNVVGISQNLKAIWHLHYFQVLVLARFRDIKKRSGVWSYNLMLRFLIKAQSTQLLNLQVGSKFMKVTSGHYKFVKTCH